MSYGEIIAQLGDQPQPDDILQYCRERITEVTAITGRPLLLYVANFLQGIRSSIKHEDKTALSDMMDGVNTEEIDFMINSPGGSPEVTETMVNMLRSKYSHIRFAIPNMAKSAATLLCLSGDELLMDHRSELGPTDPQITYTSGGEQRMEAAEDILDGFEDVKKKLKTEGVTALPAYSPLINKYSIALFAACENARQLTRTLATNWLSNYMFVGQPDAAIKADEITEMFANHALTLSHNRAISIDQCIGAGMKVVDLRRPEQKQLDDALWRLWCGYERFFEKFGGIYKVYQSSTGGLLLKFQQMSQSSDAKQQQTPKPSPALPKGQQSGPVMRKKKRR